MRYSATVSGYLEVNGHRLRIAKTNQFRIVLAEPCPLDIRAGTRGVLEISVDEETVRGPVSVMTDVRNGESIVYFRRLSE